MTRALLLLALLLALAATATSARAQSATEICGGHFERYLQGFTIGDGELDHFLRDDDAVADCRAALDKTDLEHRLIDAFILQHQNAPEREASLILFEAACAQGSALGCFYATYGPAHPPRHFGKFDPSNGRKMWFDLPAADTLAGQTFFASPALSRGDEAVALGRLDRASDQGDYWATELLAIVASIEGGEPGLQAMLALMRKAADQGHVPSLNKLAGYRIWRHGDHDGAIALFRRAATADPRWFRNDIAWAQYCLGMLLRDGERVRRDPAEAQRWLESAAKLGNTAAEAELEKK